MAEIIFINEAGITYQQYLSILSSPNPLISPEVFEALKQPVDNRNFDEWFQDLAITATRYINDYSENAFVGFGGLPSQSWEKLDWKLSQLQLAIAHQIEYFVVESSYGERRFLNAIDNGSVNTAPIIANYQTFKDQLATRVHYLIDTTGIRNDFIAGIDPVETDPSAYYPIVALDDPSGNNASTFTSRSPYDGGILDFQGLDLNEILTILFTGSETLGTNDVDNDTNVLGGSGTSTDSQNNLNSRLQTLENDIGTIGQLAITQVSQQTITPAGGETAIFSVSYTSNVDFFTVRWNFNSVADSIGLTTSVIIRFFVAGVQIGPDSTIVIDNATGRDFTFTSPLLSNYIANDAIELRFDMSGEPGGSEIEINPDNLGIQFSFASVNDALTVGGLQNQIDQNAADLKFSTNEKPKDFGIIEGLSDNDKIYTKGGVDDAIGAATGSFVGEIKSMPFDLNAVDADWVECVGTVLDRIVYATLFARIGTSYGIGDGSTTFNIPDFATDSRFMRHNEFGTTQENATYIRGNGSNPYFNLHTYDGSNPISENPANGFSISNTGGGTGDDNIEGSSTDEAMSRITLSLSTLSDGATETRPNNLGVKFYIKIQ